MIGAVLFVYASVLIHLFQTWWVDENYSYGFLIPFVIAYLVWDRRATLTKSATKPCFFAGGLVILLSLFALWTGVAGAELFVQRLSFVFIIGGLILYLRGADLLRMVWLPLTLLLLAVPIPAILLNQIALPLQLFASRCAVWAMRAFDVPVLRQGNVIELVPLNSVQTRKLEVAEACSGIRSLMSLITLGVLVAYFTRPTLKAGSKALQRQSIRLSRKVMLWRSALTVCAAIPIAVLTNALRVSGTGILAHYYGTRVADGFFHQFSGWLIFLAALVLLFVSAWTLDKFLILFLREKAIRSGSAPESSPMTPSPVTGSHV